MARFIRLLIAVPLMVVGVMLVVGLVLVLTNPSPRQAPGWSLAAPMPGGPRGEVTTAVADGRLYVIGGLLGPTPGTSDRVEAYDPATDTWTAAPSLPAPRHHTAAVGLDGVVYVSGGAPSLERWSTERNLWRLAADGWSELAPMPEGRWGHRLVTLDGLLYAVGGAGGDAVLIYDPAADAWSTGAALPHPRDHLAVAVVGGEIWAMGGRNGGVQDRVDIYDPLSDVWRDGPALPAPTSGAGEAAAEGLVVISGGEDPAPLGEGVYDRHWWLDTTEIPAWRELPPPPLAIHGAEGAVIDGRFYLPGGATRAGAQSIVSFVSELQVLELAGLD